MVGPVSAQFVAAGFKTACAAMPIERHFLDWSQPGLPATADWLVSRYARDAELDLGQVIVVVPGSRAGRRLLELLVTRAEAVSQILTPPTIVTEHALPELLYQPRRPFASPLAQQLAWGAALRETPAAQRGHFLPHPPAVGDTARWLELGGMLRGLHVELAADGLDCGDVLAAGEQVEGFAEHERWQALADVQARYLRKLDELGLWDIQTARLVAIRRREPQTDHDVVLVGMVDLNRAQRQLLDLVADRVTALVVAPPALADRFDPHGCLLPDRWSQAEVPIHDEQVLRADGPADQADAACRWLAALGGKYRADQVVVGVPDERLAAQLQRRLSQCGVGSRWLEARRVGETGPFRLLQLATALAERKRFADLAALVRHPDVYDWLLNQLRQAGAVGFEPLAALDEFAARQFPASLDRERLVQDEQLRAVRAIDEVMERLLQRLPAQQQSLIAWAASFRGLLMSVYGERTLDRNQPVDRQMIGAFQTIEAGLADLERLPPPLACTATAREAFHMALAPLAKESIPPPAESDVVEVLGWLELPLDDAPALFVTSFNEGWVPKSAGRDPFLPDRLRQQLGLLDNDRRYARDAYATCVLLHSRAELQLVVAHRDVEGNPLAPSRLLFAADEDTVARRALRFFGDLPPSPPRRNLLVPTGKPLAVSALPIPDPKPPAETLDRISVTAFKAYLACPYRYYLRHVLKLETLSDSQAELDPAAFGNLLHDVLQRFGRSEEAGPARGSVDPEEVFNYLSDFLSTLAAARFGLSQCRPAVRVQVEQARSRLKALAAWQARRTQQGWQIIHSEDAERQLVGDFELDSTTAIKLHGRIDRIDFHTPSQTLAILDYKTADAGLNPEQTHRRGDEWLDLQLPLYRHLVQAAKLHKLDLSSCRIELGYILLPKDVRKVGQALAAWSQPELLAADEVARQVIRKIRAGVFQPRAVPPPAFCEDLAPITQDHRLGTRHAAAEGDAA
jgi:hypothetical protein